MSGNDSVPPFPGALPPPPGVVPDITSDGRDSMRTVWIAAYSVMLVVPTLLLALRVYIRRSLVKVWLAADYAVVAAWAFFVCQSALGLCLIRFRLGHDAWDVAPPVFARFAEYLNIQQIVYMPGISLTKISILLQLHEIFVTVHTKSRHWALCGLIAFNAVFFLLLMFLETFQCLPRVKIWNPAVPGHCIDIQSTFVATGVINVVDDFAILILPISWIFQLRTSTRKKLSISSIFLVGLFACVCSIMRLAESIINLRSSNITVDLLPVSMWATAEVSAGLVVAALPQLPRLLRRPTPGSRLANYRAYFSNLLRRSDSSSLSLTEPEQPFPKAADLSKSGDDGLSWTSEGQAQAQGIVRTVQIETTYSPHT